MEVHRVYGQARPAAPAGLSCLSPRFSRHPRQISSLATSPLPSGVRCLWLCLRPDLLPTYRQGLGRSRPRGAQEEPMQMPFFSWIGFYYVWCLVETIHGWIHFCINFCMSDCSLKSFLSKYMRLFHYLMQPKQTSASNSTSTKAGPARGPARPQPACRHQHLKQQPPAPQ